jgi:GNAT superfamily N-acetyltransferase
VSLPSASTRLEDEIRIETAVAADAGDIYGMVVELADFEQLLDECVATEDRLRESLFGDRPCAEALIARLGAESVGFALFFRSYSTFRAQPGIFLEDLYVKPEQRGSGVGTRLLARVAQLAVERGCGRLEWAALDWNTNAVDFYKRLDAEPLEEWTTFRIGDDPLKRLAARGAGS